jgi:hypothetical protein
MLQRDRDGPGGPACAIPSGFRLESRAAVAARLDRRLSLLLIGGLAIRNLQAVQDSGRI